MPRGTKPGIRSALGASVGLLGWVVSILAAAGAEVNYALHIDNGHVPAGMQLIRVTQGDVVTLRWTTDKPSIVHLHGYDVEKRVVPGAVTELTFTAHATGRFQVHLHAGTAEAHGREDALVTIEVYPR